MRNLFHITLLLMLSLPVFAGIELSTLAPDIDTAKSLSPTFIEDVMANIKDIEKECRMATSSKQEAYDALMKAEKSLKRKPSGPKDFLVTIVSHERTAVHKATLTNKNKVLISALTSQIEKIQGAKQGYLDYLKTIEVPMCDLKRYGIDLKIPKPKSLIERSVKKHSATVALNYSINYLKEIRKQLTDLPATNRIAPATPAEKKAYSNCSEKLTAVIKEVK